MRVAVIGAGPAGMTAAYCLSRAGASVEVFEAGGSVGGLAKTIELWGQRVDLGPHRFFSRDARVNRLWLEVVGPDYRMVDRLTRIYYGGRFFHYPLQASDALAKLGPAEAARCAASYLKEQLVGARAQEADTFEDWVVSRFGRRLYEIFFRSYSEKLWGISCQELDADFAAQRIRQFSLSAAIRAAVFGDVRGRHSTLVDRFAYPLEGTGAVYQRMARAVEERGHPVHLHCPVHRVLVRDGRAVGVELETGEARHYDHLVSTMPLTLLVTRVLGVPEEIRERASMLTFRNTILVYLKVMDPQVFPDQWLYIHAPELRMGRITNFRNWVPTLYGDDPGSILCLEYWCYDYEPIWAEDEAALLDLARAELRHTGLIGDAPVGEGMVYRIHRCYPVYARGYRQHLGPVEAYLSSIAGLSVIGRYGAFKYNNQDHSILMGLLAAENVLQDAGHDLWGVNTDYDSYQEASTITEAGLEMEPASALDSPPAPAGAGPGPAVWLDDLPCHLCGCSEPRVRLRDGRFRVVRCPRCGLHYTLPRLAAPHLVGMYQQDYWRSDRAREFGYTDYLGQRDHYLRTFRRRARLVVRHRPRSGRVLEVGCAAGYFLAVMRDLGWECHGVEPSALAADYARRQMGLAHITHGTLADAHLPPGSFDVAALWDVLEHVASPRELLQQLHVLLAGDGILVVETQNIASAWARLMGRRWQHYKHQEHLYHFDRATLGQLLRRCGFREIENTTRHAGKYITPAFVQERVGRLHPLLARLARPLAVLDRTSFYVNLGDEMISVARKA